MPKTSVAVKRTAPAATPAIHNPRPRLISTHEAALRLGLSRWTLRDWCYRGRISSYKLGKTKMGRLMVSEAEIDRVIAESERPRRTA